MSRTIRRKGMKYPWKRRTREDFNENREKFLEGSWRAERRVFDYWKGEWKTVKGSWHDRVVTWHENYDQYIAADDAKYHSDSGWGCEVPKNFRQMLNRRLRARHKEQLVEAMTTGEEEGLLLQKFSRDAGWWW